MRINKNLIFALFAGMILFSMLREWSAPVACMRPGLMRWHQTATAR
jgi:hypothetical protein